MPAPQCGLPLPATTTLPLQQPPTAISPPVHHGPPLRLPPPPLTQSHQQRDSWPQISRPHQDYMRIWLQAKAEEDKRRVEEERTKQESLRLEQRKLEMDMLCTSLQGGIPPAMIPLIFVRIGSAGVRPQMAGSQAYHPQLPSPQHAHPKRQRDIPRPTQTAAPAIASHPQMQQVQSSQQECQPSSSLTIYNWQPPISQAGSSSNRPGTPSTSTKTKRQ
ncbi:hypothetical protein F53441_12162 [Fusarium austroafricanum]|uniref:Uncharacterized protein n=1 Tax=Fusarium austroafricanum TaxID=2364996 RepID=A0A8H4K0H6_9HYPO|nr:hypothetical protein F53441_12162 [Fusarium austroafricanum]